MAYEGAAVNATRHCNDMGHERWGGALGDGYSTSWRTVKLAPSRSSLSA